MRCLRPTHDAIITTNRVSNGRNRCRKALVSLCRQMGAASQEGAEITDLGENNQVREEIKRWNTEFSGPESILCDITAMKQQGNNSVEATMT